MMEESKEKDSQENASPSSPVRIEGPLPSYASAVVDILKLGVPIIVNSLLSFGINRTYGMSVVGLNFSPYEITIAGVGFTLYYCCGCAVPIGFCCGVDTLCSQAHGRNPDSPEAGIWLKVGVVLTLLLTVPAAIFFLFSEPILALIFEKNMARDIAAFLLYCIPLMVAQATNICLGRGLQATKRADIPTLTALSGTTVFVIVSTLTIPLGVPWYPISLFIANVVPIAMIFLYCYFCDGDGNNNNLIAKVVWNPFSSAFYEDLSVARAKEFASIGAGASVAIASEWISLEAIVLLASQLHNVYEIAAMQVAWMIIAILFCAPLSMSVCSSAFVGNALGRNEPNHARFYGEACQVVNIAITLMSSAAIAAFNGLWIKLFTTDQGVLSVLASATVAIMLFHNAESLHICIQGIFRGLGWQSYCAKVVGFSLWCVGLPCAYLFGIKNLWRELFGLELDGVSRLFLGFSIGFVVEIGGLLYGLTLLPWKQLALEASAERKAEMKKVKRADDMSRRNSVAEI